MRIIKNFNVKKILSFFWKQNGSSYYNSKGIAVGVFSGCFPLFGFQTLIGISLAQIIRGNLTLAAIGTWISNPFTYIPLYIFNYKVGSMFIKSSSGFNIQNSFIDNQIWQRGWIFTSRLLLGSFLVGSLFGIISGLLAYLMYKYIFKKKYDN